MVLPEGKVFLLKSPSIHSPRVDTKNRLELSRGLSLVTPVPERISRTRSAVVAPID